jgi:hypothetical protein
MKGDWGDGWSGFPDGGIDARKYAAIMVALGRARGMLYDFKEVEGVREILYRTSSAAIAEVLGLKESDLAIDHEDYLTAEERERLRVAPVPADF